MIYMPIAGSEELLNVCMQDVQERYEKEAGDLRRDFSDLFKRTSSIRSGIEAGLYMQRQEDYVKFRYRLEQDRAAEVYDIEKALADRAYRIELERAYRGQGF